MGKAILTPIDNPEKVVKASNCKLDGGGNVEDALNYSTTEHVVGKWIDGSDLYAKSFDCGALSNNAVKTVPTGLSNVVIRDIRGVMWTDTYQNAQPMETVSMVSGNIYYAHTTYSYGNILIETNFNATHYNGYVTLYYTKTS